MIPRLRPPARIQTRLALLVGVAVIGVAAAAGFWLVDSQAEAAEEEHRIRAGALLRSLSVPCAVATARSEFERLDGFLAEVASVSGGRIDMRAIGLVDFQGRPLTGYRSIDGREARSEMALPVPESFLRDAVASPKALWLRIEGAAGPELIVTMPAVSGLRWGTLIAVFDLRPLEERTAFIRSAVAGASIALTLVIWAMLYFGLTRLVSRPVGLLARAAEGIQEGRLDTRVHIDSRDELGQLAQAFNDMAAQLEADTATLEARIAAGASQVRAKNRELESVNGRLRAAVDDLARLATTDELTGLANRRKLGEMLDSEVRRGRRAAHPFTLLMVDVDHFKHYNDAHGHAAGDQALRQLATCLSSALRSTDIVARYGGEEFVVLLLDTEHSAGVTAAEKVRAAVAAAAFPGGEQQPLGRVTVSVGLAHHPTHAADPVALLEKADRALYAAKAAGRNRVVSWSVDVHGLA